ncbi:MAG: peptidase domain-containing ABC transporter [Proteobacteria bacterium]|nr:peptidase domain-containing ABC transporter [Pseudomonadota bacterium]
MLRGTVPPVRRERRRRRRPSPELLHLLASSFRTGALGGFKAISDVAACLVPLLSALGWRGDPRQVAEALPHFADDLDVAGLRNVMANLGYASRPVSLPLADMDPRLAPSLFVPNRGPAMVVLAVNPDVFRVFDGGGREFRMLRPGRSKGTVYVFSRMEEETQARPRQPEHWFRGMARRFHGLGLQTFAMTLMMNLIALATPFFVMAIFDRVIGARSIPTLEMLGIGIGLALAGDLVLRLIRSRILAHVGARLDMILGSAVFQHILFLAPQFTERASVGGQIAKIREFEGIREFFTGQLALAFLELPFVVIFLAAIVLVAGPLVSIPLVMAGLFGLLGTVVLPALRAQIAAAAAAGTRREEFFLETVSKMRALKYTGAAERWLEVFRDASARNAMAHFRTAALSGVVSACAQGLMIGAGAATAAFGVLRVIDKEMTVGGLVATMILIWRVLSPIQAGFLSLNRLEQVLASIRKVNALMGLQLEREPRRHRGLTRPIVGRVTLSRVSLRYHPDADPAVLGVSFEAAPGEVVALAGPNGAGKSTILKLIAGLYQPQGGHVMIDGIDIRQFDPAALRQAIGYVPEVTDLFHGSIAENLRLAHPTATHEDLYWAASEAGVLEDVLALPEGFETWIGDQRSARMTAGMRQRLSLARAYLKRAPILLFDEPGNGLDEAADRAFIEFLAKRRGRSTIIVATHRPSHMRSADRVLVLDAGSMRFAGTAEETFRQIPREFL